MLFAVWSDQTHRPTLDLDLEGRGDSSLEHLKGVFRNLCRIESPGDGLSFDPESVRATVIRELQQYPGARILLAAHLATARIPLRVDIGFGDAVVPEPALVEYPCLLGHAAPRLKAYPRETVVSEKFQIMVFLGMANTRMKDFYDLWLLARSMPFAGTDLARAISATFDRRRTPIPSERPVALTPEFFEDDGKRKAWQAFLSRSRLTRHPLLLAEVCSLLERFLMPPSMAAATGEPFDARWFPAETWQ